MSSTAEGQAVFVERDGRPFVMPTHVQLESVGGTGMCTARCSMCTIEDWQRPPTVMDFDKFAGLVSDLEPYREHVEYFTMHGNGEPLMDPRLAEKIALLKAHGFRGTGFATNCTLLTEAASHALLDAGLDTLICSIDGAKAETHEAIRGRTKFAKVVENVQRYLQLRDEKRAAGKSVGRVMIRFIRQELNRDEWDEYRAFWEQHITRDAGDVIVYFDIHNWGGQLENAEAIRALYGGGEAFRCDDLYDRLIVFADGDLAHCDADYNGFFEHGNVFEEHFLDVFNSTTMRRYRDAMENGRLCELEHCSSCTIPIRRATRGS